MVGLTAFADTKLTLSEWMRTRYSDPVARVLHPFAGRYTVQSCAPCVIVDPTLRRVTVDPALARQLTTQEDLALWVIAARNLLLIRGVVGSRATNLTLRWWELAWVLAHAAASYHLPRRTCAAMFSPQGTLLDRVLSLQWNSVFGTDAPRALLERIPRAVRGYHTWMNLGDQLLPWLQPPGDHVPLLSDTTLSEFGIDEPTDRGSGPRWLPVPPVDRAEFRWALDSLTSEERDKNWPTLPSTAAMTALRTFAEAPDVQRYTYRLGHLGRREVIRYALGIPTPFGRVPDPEQRESPWAVYLDVSGSMRAYASIAWAVMRSLPEGSTLHVFSGFVADADPTASKVLSDGLTSYNAVADHILATGATDVIVVTDDQDSLSKDRLDKLKDVNLTVVCIGDGVKPPRTFSDAASTRIDLPSS